jgi:hypothetical protein
MDRLRADEQTSQTIGTYKYGLRHEFSTNSCKQAESIADTRPAFFIVRVKIRETVRIFAVFDAVIALILTRA